MSGKVNAKLKSVEDECESLRRSLFVEVDGRKELEGTVPGVCDLNECVTLIHRNLLLVIRNNIYVCVCVCSGIETGGSGGSMNRAPELLGAKSSGATKHFSYTVKILSSLCKLYKIWSVDSQKSVSLLPPDVRF